MKTVQELQDIANQVRRDILRMTTMAKSGHPGGSLGCADLLTLLYFNEMNVKPERFRMSGENEDLFFLSNGHISPVLYSVLARRGYFPVAELATFRKLNSRLQGHPSIAHDLPGIRMASGSLGQGLSCAIGAALAKKMSDDKSLVYCLCGDGELQEGQNWEALMFGSAHGVDNLIAIVDANGLQIDGSTNDVCNLGCLSTKFASFGWIVVEADGNDMAALQTAIKQAQKELHGGQPVIINMRTEMGRGVDFMVNQNKYHGSVLSPEMLEKALAQLPETLGDF